METNTELSLSSLISKPIYSFQSPCPQQFSLPYPIIKYLFTNSSSPKLWRKLIQTCKYFYFKYPVIPVFWMESTDNSKWRADKDIFGFKNVPSNLWLYDIFYARFLKSRNELSKLIPKIFKCDIQHLWIHNQNLTFEEYRFLASSPSLKWLYLSEKVKIKYGDGSNVTMDKLMEQLTENVVKLKLYTSPSMFKPDTVKNIMDLLPRFKKLCFFELHGLSNNFNLSLFSEYFWANKTTQIHLSFNNFGLSYDSKKAITECMEKIIKNPPKIIPLIHQHHYDLFYNLKYKELCERQQKLSK